jgi:hypothetical protein
MNQLTSAQIHGHFMQTHTISRFASRLTLPTIMVLATACGDSRLGKLSTGISRDSALAIINEGAGGDSLARVYRQESYLLSNGKRGNAHSTNVLFYNKSGVKEADDPKLAPEKTTPIVVSDGKVIGWGWTYYDSLSKANNIPLKQRN